MHESATEPVRAGAAAPDDPSACPAPEGRGGEHAFERRGGVRRALGSEGDFRTEATTGVAITGALLLLPWAAMNLVGGDPLIGTVALAVVALLATLVVFARDHGAALRTGPLSLLMTFAVVSALCYTVVTLGIAGILWCYPAALGFYGLLEERRARAANALLLGTALPLAFTVLETPLALRATATLACASLFGAIMVRTIERQQEALRRRAETDPLTRLSNRHGLHEALEAAAGSSARTDGRPALLIVDLDHFKRVNDSHGHAVGDGVLRAVGALLSASARAGERAFRLGGEEFLLLVETASDEALKARAQTVRRAVEEARTPGLPPVTASIGTAAARAGERAEEWLARADAALYRAKAEGRNRVESG